MPDLDLIKQGEQGVRVRRYRIFDHLKTHRHCEPLGRRDAPPEDRLREAISGRDPSSGRDCFVAQGRASQ